MANAELVDAWQPFFGRAASSRSTATTATYPLVHFVMPADPFAKPLLRTPVGSIVVEPSVLSRR
jgi:hypothetical protein